MRITSNVSTFLVFVLLIVIIGALFAYGHYFWGLLVLFLYYEGYQEHIFHKPIRNEINWLKHCISGLYNINDYKEEDNFYTIVVGKIQDKTIKKGMTIEDIYKVINEHIETKLKDHAKWDSKYFESLREHNKRYFQKEGRGIDESVIIYGYLQDPLTIKLQLRFRNNRLLSWEYLSLD